MYGDISYIRHGVLRIDRSSSLLVEWSRLAVPGQCSLWFGLMVLYLGNQTQKISCCNYLLSSFKRTSYEGL